MFIEKLFWSFLDFMNLMLYWPLPRLALLHNPFVSIVVCNFLIFLENVSYLFGQAVKFVVSFLQILRLQLLSWKNDMEYFGIRETPYNVHAITC